MQQSPFDDLPREEIEISQSAVRSVSGGKVTVTQSAVQHLLAAEADIRQSSVGTVKGEKVSLKQAATLSVFGRDVSVDGRSRVLLLAAPTVRGTVRPVLTVPSAFALGAGFFFGRWLTRSLGRLLKG
jgi:hypothetical protein